MADLVMVSAGSRGRGLRRPDDSLVLRTVVLHEWTLWTVRQ